MFWKLYTFLTSYETYYSILNSTTVPQIVKFDQKNNILVRAKKPMT